jgi:hypothetical protein
MSETLTKVVVNCETGVTEIIPLTAEEIADRETAAAAYAVEQAERIAAAEATAEAKASGIAKLLALGLTEAEANALVK